MANDTAEEQLSRLFGSYKAEWLREQLFELFTEPAYFPELKTGRPCVLEGGRGTGKTTVLRCLSYEGQFALAGKDPTKVPNWPYYGFYYRVNTNRVTAFRGGELQPDVWSKVFGHYFNLEFCDLVFRFLGWYRQLGGVEGLVAADYSDVARGLCLDDPDSITSLDQVTRSLQKIRISFEASINNISDVRLPPLSLQGQPIDLLMSRLLGTEQFAGRDFFFLIDEYENFEPYQQRIVNTLIKHSGEYYTFKIGVRELGWRRETNNPSENLRSPADYVGINIAAKLGDKFQEFASSVCNERLRRLSMPGEAVLPDVMSLLPGLSEDEEADRLGVAARLVEARKELARDLSSDDLQLFDRLPPLKAYLLVYWSQGSNMSLLEVFRDFMNDRRKWDSRYGNYKYSTLFTIRKGKTGIRKYYAGWAIFTQLAGCNIRYLLELVDHSLIQHLRGAHDLSVPVSYEMQTEAAQRVGQKNLTELESFSVNGARLTKFLLALGRVFQVMALRSAGHTPEAVQFHLSDDPVNSAWAKMVQKNGWDVEEFLRTAVMHLALVRFPGNKLQEGGDTREFDYMIHPLYAAFFMYSHRKKRKLLLSEMDIWGLVYQSRTAIERLLREQHRPTDEPLPEQLQLFEGFYGKRA